MPNHTISHTLSRKPMKNKLAFASSCFLLALVPATVPVAHSATENYAIDPAHSTVSFKVKHLMISTVTGSFSDFEGTGTFDPDNPAAASIEVTVQAASINTNNKKRDGHLRDEDFFHVEKFPTLSFKSTEIKKNAEGTYDITGDFTLRGVTKPISFTAAITDQIDGMKEGEKRRGGEATFRIKRSDFGMNHMVGPIGDDIDVTLAFSGVLQ